MKPSKHRSVLWMLVLASCADEGITHIAGPYPVSKHDAGKAKPSETDAENEEESEESPAAIADAGKRDAEAVDAAFVDAAVADAAPETLACPKGYECKDPAGPLAEMGLTGTITDPDGEPVAFSCAKGGQEECDPKDPVKSCPNFSEPYCVHLKLNVGVVPVDLYQCAQRCTP